MDLTEKPFSIKDDIESLEKRGILIKKGTLSKSDLKDIYVKINKNKFISKIDKTNIRDSLRLIGITGLPD
ncbi:hypothetical protein CH375_11850 [Leptospira ellisii]|nr:hypothetical protein CH375_11850 [Leptospira ellisii]